MFSNVRLTDDKENELSRKKQSSHNIVTFCNISPKRIVQLITLDDTNEMSCTLPPYTHDIAYNRSVHCVLKAQPFDYKIYPT